MCISKLNKIEEYLTTSVDDLIISPLTVSVINKEFVEKFNELTTKFGSAKIGVFLKAVRNDNKLYRKFLYRDFCPKCNEFFEKEITQTKLKSGVNINCLLCSEKENKFQRRIDDMYFNKFIDDMENNRVSNTKEYIKNYLNPLPFFNKDVALNVRWNQITYDDFDYNRGEINQYIKSMDYKTFLQTPYWKTVSYKRKAQCEFKCQLCNSGKDLETHHPTYDIRGEEIFNMKKLTVLCHSCHEKYHK